MKKHFLFLSALALFLSSCEIFSSLSEKTGAISIKMPEGSERIAETYDVNEITSFTAELYDSGSSPIAKAACQAMTDADARKRGDQTGLDTLVVHAVNDDD